MRTVEWRFEALEWRRWLAAACLVVLSVSPARAQVAAGYSEYYIPGDETNMRLVFNTLDGAGANYGMHAVIAVTAWSANTTVYYDHWEDGYDFDPLNPSTADETVVLADTGDQRVFESANIPTNPRGTTTYYDGGDRIYVAGGVVTVTRASWIENVGVGNQAAAWEIYPVKPQLTTYVVPFGEDLGFVAFNRVFALIQATADNTVVTVDVNGDGTPESIDWNRDGTADGTSRTLSRGETILLDRTSALTSPLPTGVVIQGSRTLQVKFVAGNPGQRFCARGLSAFPRGFWTKDYYAPFNQPTNAGVGDTDYFLYNPHSSAITISWESRSSSGSFTIPAGSTVSFRALAGPVPVDSGLYLKGSDVFWGVGMGDSTGAAFEWGYSLLPSTFLFEEHFLGWAPGSIAVDTTGNPGNQDNDGVFLTVAQDNTRVFVDFDNDGAADLVDANLDGTPESAYVTLNRLQTQFFYDPTNAAGGGDLSRAHFWATGPFTMAYGENGDTATTSTPSLDLGYIAIPGTDFVSLVLTVDKSVSPQAVPTASGSTATFTLTVSSQKYTVDGVNVTDLMPPSWQYVAGSATIVRPDKTTLSGTSADPAITGAPATGQTLAWSTAQVGNASAPSMLQNQEITLTFTGQTTTAFTAGALSQNRVTAVGTRTVGGVTQTFTAKNFAYVTYGNVRIAKTSSVGASTPLYPGDPLTYTVAVTNPAGGTTLTGVSVYDPIPTGTTYVAASGSVTCETGSRDYQDQFASAAYNLTTGSVNWAPTPWTETDSQGGGATGGLVWVTGGQLQFRYTSATYLLDQFGNQAYNNSNGTASWAGNLWTETDAVGGGATGGLVWITPGGGTPPNQLQFRYLTATDYLDQFGTVAYNNSNGTANWTANSWTETDSLGGGAASGLVLVTGGAGGVLQLRGAVNVRDEFSARNYNNTNGSVDWSANPWTETDRVTTTPLSQNGFVLVNGNALQLRSGATTGNVADGFSSSSYARNDGSINWSGPWTETGDDGTAGGGSITVNAGNNSRVNFGPGAAGRAITRTAPVSGTSATISFTLSDQGIDNGEGVVAEYQLDAGPFQSIQSIDNNTYTGTNPLTINTAGATSITLRFTTFGSYEAGGFSPDNAGVDAVNIAFFNAVGSQVQRTANLTGATTASLSFNYTSANLVAGDTVVVEASNSAGGPFTVLATIDGGGTATVSYPLASYISANTTIRFRVTSGFAATNKTISIDNVDVGYASYAVPGTQVQRTANLTGATTASLGFDYTSANLVAGDTVVVEASSSAGGPFTVLATIDGGGTATVSYPLASYISANTTIRFRATSGFAATNKTFSIDNVQIMYASYGVPGTQIQRTAPLAGAPVPLLTFNTASINLVAGDTLVVEASSSAAGPFTILATFAGGTPDVAQPYDLTSYRSATTTLRFRVTGGFAASTKTFSIDNVDIAYGVLSTFASGNPPEFLSASAGCAVRAGGTPATLTFNATVDNPLPSGTSSITNTASTTSAQFPLALSASVRNIVADPTVLSASVAGRAWFDVDADGAQDIGEPGLPNVEVTLKDRFGAPVATTRTDANGRYLFPGVLPGAGYYVEVTDGLPGGVTQTFPLGRSDNRTGAFDLVAGQAYEGADLGYRSAAGVAAFGDLAWVDPNANGLRDSGEIGLGGVTVRLYEDSNGNNRYDDGVDVLRATTTSAPDGSYLFTNVAAGSTYIVIATTPFTPGAPEYTPTTAASFVFPSVASGAAYVTADFGFRGDTISTYTLADRVWLDVSDDGLLNGGEFGIAGVTVSLLDASLNVIGTTLTAADGTFTFSGLAGAGADYTVRLSDSGGILTDYVGTTSYAQARQRAESNLTADVDRRAAPSYGFRASRAIGDTVFFDIDGDGTQDAGENGIAGVVVSLYRDTDNDGFIDGGEPQVGGSVTTDANGQYLFAGLTNGNYIVSVATPVGYSFTGPGTDSDTGTAGVQKRATMSGTNIDTVDFGFRAPAGTSRTISGVFWNNEDGDGVIDTGEARLAGVTLNILSGSTVVATVTTDATGAYSVAGLASGTYTVRVTDTGGVLTGYAPNYERSVGTAGPFDYQEVVDASAGDATDVNFGYARPVPTYASVAYLTAYLADGSVTVEWRTTLEVGTAGFHLLRLDPSTGQYVRITEKRVPGLVVHPQGGVYRFLDAGAPTEGRLSYRLVEEDVRGRSREYGPYSVSPEVAPRALDPRTTEDLRNRAFSRRPASPTRARQAIQAAVEAERQRIPRGGLRRQSRVFKMTTREAGIHYLPAAAIAPSLGPPAWIANLIRAGQLTLSQRGRVVPCLPDARGAGIYFYAVPVGSPYTDENAYWVTVTPGETMSARPAPPTGPLATSFTETLHQEQEQYPVLLNFRDPEGDFWVWDYLYAGYEGLDARSFPVRAQGVAGTGEASLAVHLLGGTDSGPGNDHHVQVLFNGQPVGEARWDGLAPLDIEFPLATAGVLEGDNVVELRAVLDAGVSDSLFYVDSFDLTYERLYQAVDDTLSFTAASGTDVAIGGFSGPGVLLFDVTDPSHPVVVTGYEVSRSGDGQYEARFGAAGASETLRYQALLPSRARLPLSVAAWQDAGLRRETNAADYVLVVPESLKEAARPLAEYRRGQGIDTMVVGLEDIYDEFNAGIAEPPAIKTFLRHATSRWSKPPRYVTLVGRGTYDYRNLAGFGDNLLPTLLIGSPDGLVASDVAFADLSGDDGVPEVALGRLPVLTAAELADYVAKIQAHEGEASGEWQRHVLMAADNPDLAGNFTADSESVAALLPPDYTAGRVHLDATTPEAARQSILQAIDDGVVAFNYIGHGGVDRLAQESIFTSADVAGLHNSDRLPIFLAMTCSVGNFAMPGYPSLGEAMLLRKDGGAFAVWSPSGLSENPSAVRLDQSFFRGAFVDRERIVGDLVVRSLGELDTPGAEYIRYMYNLLGEPVSRLPD